MIVHSGNALKGKTKLPGDKSLSHRAALFASIASGNSQIENFLDAGVTRALLNALANMRIRWTLDGSILNVDGRGLMGMITPKSPIHCGNSGTTMRLLAGAIAASGIGAVLDGTPRLRSRPMDRIILPLTNMRVRITSVEQMFAPLEIHPRHSRTDRIRAIDYDMPIASAQVKTCIMLAALAGDGVTTLREPGPSRDHTERLFHGMGVLVQRTRIGGEEGKKRQFEIKISPPSDGKIKPLNIRLPGDFSSAAFLIVAALITPGSQITLESIGLNPTRTGLLDALQMMGADIQTDNVYESYGEPIGDITVKHSSLRGVEIAGPLVVRMIDEFPVFAVAAAFADGITFVRDAEELRFKESDRIARLAEQLTHIGVAVTETPDGFSLTGGKIPGGQQVDPYNDHRLAMSLAVAGLAAERPIKILGSDIIKESFPEFTEILSRLGADIQ